MPPAANCSIRWARSALHSARSRGHTGSTATRQYLTISAVSTGSCDFGSSYSGRSTSGSRRPWYTQSSSARTLPGGVAATTTSSSSSTSHGRVELGAAKSNEYGVLGARAVSRSTRSPPRRPRTVDSQAPYIWWRLRSCSTRRLATSSRTGEWAKRSWARSVCAMSISITSPTSSSKPVTLPAVDSAGGQ
jgi:hypothetical protein